MKKILGFLFSRLFIIGIFILFQIVFLFIIISQTMKAPEIYTMASVSSIFVLIWIFQLNINPSYKLVWTIVIMALPPFGGILYLLVGANRLSKNTKKRLNQAIKDEKAHQIIDEKAELDLKELDSGLYTQMCYIKNTANAPVYTNTSTKYFPCGEKFLQSMLQELENAQKCIFLEYFIVEPGKMFDSICEVLIRKVKLGVDVRLLYDDIGSINTFPRKKMKILRAKGIKVVVFNPLHPSFNIFMNNRDHRKICVIDGDVGYMGGINLADEYINEKAKYGHWKDTAFMIKGKAVWSLSSMFIGMWYFACGEQMDYKKYYPKIKIQESDGFIQPFGDSPLDDINVSENEYINIISKAEKYVYITSPYLILDSQLTNALCVAAKSSIDVRIITPHVPDKWFVHYVTQSHYNQLAKAGVKIYEYTPGFIHAKMFVSDDKVAVIGTVNLDYRSLFLHFECCTAFMYSSIVNDVKKDFEDTIKLSKQIRVKSTKEIGLIKSFLMSVLRIFAPFM